MPTQAEIQADEFVTLISELSEDDVALVMGANMVETAYMRYADKNYVPRLRLWYARREILAFLLSSRYPLAGNTKLGPLEVSGNLTILRGLWDIANTEVLRLEGLARAVRPTQAAQMTATAPQMAVAGQVDPNDSAFRGDPLRRTYYPR